MQWKSLLFFLIALQLLVACDDKKSDTAGDKADSVQTEAYQPREKKADLSKLLILKMKAGDRYTMTMITNDSIHSVLTNELSEKLQENIVIQENELHYNINVLDVEPNGDFTIGFTISEINYHLKQNGELTTSFKSREIKDRRQVPEDFVAKYTLIGKTLYIKLNNMGVVQEVMNTDSIVDVYVNELNPKSKQVRERLKEIAYGTFGFQTQYKFFADILNYTTEKAVFFQTQWTKSFEYYYEKPVMVEVNYAFDHENDSIKTIVFEAELIDPTANKEKEKGQYLVKTHLEGKAKGAVLIYSKTNFLKGRDMSMAVLYTETHKRRNDDKRYLHSTRRRYTEQIIYLDKKYY